MNVVQLRPATPDNENELVPVAPPRLKYSFDMTQEDPRGFVLIDACVPMALAVEFMNLITAYSINE